jgi:hypothetical protein
MQVVSEFCYNICIHDVDVAFTHFLVSLDFTPVFSRKYVKRHKRTITSPVESRLDIVQTIFTCSGMMVKICIFLLHQSLKQT